MLLSALSGLLVALAAEPLVLSPFLLISLIPWMIALWRAGSLKQAFYRSCVFAYAYGIFVFPWVAYVVHQYSGLPWVLVILIFLIFGFLSQPQIYFLGPLFYLAFVRIKALRDAKNLNHRALRITCLLLLLPAAYSAIDWFLPKLFVDTLGHALTHWMWLIQSCDWGGPPVLTWYVVSMNVLIFSAYLNFTEKKWGAIFCSQRKLTACLVLLGLFLNGTLYTYGKYKIQTVQNAQAKVQRVLNAAVIQANIGDIEKISAETGIHAATERVMRTFYRMSKEALQHDPKPDVLIWPETSYPTRFRKPETLQDRRHDEELEAFSHENKVPIAFGGYDEIIGTPYNALFFLAPDGALQKYYKTILLLFGETLPGATFFPEMKKWFPMMGFFGVGPGPVHREVVGTLVQPVICYEILFPEFTNKSDVLGTQWILNVTNDSWFGAWGAPYHHFNLARLRAIESRIPLIRSTNTGITAMILPTGEIIDPTPLFQEKISYYPIPIFDQLPPTVIKKYGSVFFYFLCLITAIGALSLWKSRTFKP